MSILKQKTRTISRLVTLLNISVESVRYYERRGLIQQPLKPDVGYRHYPDETLNRIRFIKKAQSLGFTPEEILHLLTVNDSPCSQVQVLAERKLVTVKNRIADLMRLDTALEDMIRLCQNNEDDEHCPIIDSLQP